MNRLDGIKGPNAVIELPDEYDASTRLGKALTEAVEIFEKVKAKKAEAEKAEEEAEAA